MPKKVVFLFSLVLAVWLAGCGVAMWPTAERPKAEPAGDGRVQPQPDGSANVDRPDLLSAAGISGMTAVPITGPIACESARNEWTSFILQLSPTATSNTLTLGTLSGPGGTIDPKAYRVYQILPVPVDLNRAGFVRHTGLAAALEPRQIPRALLPVAVDAGRVDLTRLRDPLKPADPAGRGMGGSQPLLLWVELQVPIAAKPGRYQAAASLNNTSPPPAPAKDAPPLAVVQMSLDVLDFVLPDDRHLVMTSDVAWSALRKFWPERFEVIRPALLNRRDKDQKAAVQTLDEMVKIAQAHRVQVHFPRLQPTVKWASGMPPSIDWSDYDSVVAPWLNGTAFEDQVPLGYWSLPQIDYLENYPPGPQGEYYAAAAAHFDQLEWLARAPVVLNKQSPGRADVSERLSISSEAARVLSAHPRLRVSIPLEPDEVQLADDRNPNLISALTTGRLECAAPGLIASSPLRTWPAELERPRNWLRTDLRGLIPYAGAGGEEGDVRVWAWMAFLRNARTIQWENCLPTGSGLEHPADPNELIWFYPGSWFGVDEVVPTVQLKWLRRAQQDFEYLYLARERGSVRNVLPMCRVLTKPVEIQPGQSPDTTYSLLIGTADQQAWRQAQSLLGRIVLARGPGITTDETALANLDVETFHWMEPLEKPAILPRTTTWNVGVTPAGETGAWANLRLGIDIYNASDTRPDQNQLRFDQPAPGWEVPPAPATIPQLTMYQVQRQNVSARLNPNRVQQSQHQPVQVTFRSGFSGRTTPVQFVAPVTRSLRAVKLNPVINGSLEEWRDDYDAIQLGPLVRMYNRPAVQKHALEKASTPSSIYSAWSDTDLYMAFKVEGVSQRSGPQASRNFVDYQYGRAWSEDLCQMVVQAMYDDGTLGPLVHVALKPGGNLWVERRLDPRLHVNPWQSFESGIRYANTLDKTVWRGEMAIPWKALIAEERTADFASRGRPNVPSMLKFNFIQHKRDTGESSSWAGPIDVGRDDRFTGVIVLKEAGALNPPAAVGQN